MQRSTAALKRGPLNRLITRLANEVWAREPDRTEPVRILNCQGMRAQESAARAKKHPLSLDERTSTTRKEVSRYLPMHAWTVDEVWAVPHGIASDA